MRVHFEDLESSERVWLEEARDEVDALRQLRSGCPSVRLIRAAQAEALPEELQAAVADHLGSCRSCRRLEEDIRSLPPHPEIAPKETERILRRVRSESSGDLQAGLPAGRGFLWKALLVAASLAIGFVALWQLRDAETQPAPAEVAVTELEAPPPPQAPESPILEKPDVKLTLAVLTWRGSDRQGLLSDIAPALDHYRGDRFGDAASEFEALTSKYPGSVEVHFYLGVSRLFLGEYTAAIQALEQAAETGDALFSDDVSWYLGLACQRSGRLSEARALFSGLCSGKSVYSEPGCEAVETLSRASVPP